MDVPALEHLTVREGNLALTVKLSLFKGAFFDYTTGIGNLSLFKLLMLKESFHDYSVWKFILTLTALSSLLKQSLYNCPISLGNLTVAMEASIFPIAIFDSAIKSGYGSFTVWDNTLSLPSVNNAIWIGNCSQRHETFFKETLKDSSVGENQLSFSFELSLDELAFAFSGPISENTTDK